MCHLLATHDDTSIDCAFKDMMHNDLRHFSSITQALPALGFGWKIILNMFQFGEQEHDSPC